MFINDVNAITGIKRLSRAELSRRLGETSANLGQKLNRDYLADTTMKDICDVMNVKIAVTYTDADTGEVIYKSEF